MIYVILGIGILVASFVIALVSLIREQNRLQAEEEKQRYPVDSHDVHDLADKAEQVHAAGPTHELPNFELQVPQPDVQRLQDTHPYDIKNQPQAANAVPWWEAKLEGKGLVDTEDKVLSDEDREIEQVRAELARIKSLRLEEKNHPQGPGGTEQSEGVSSPGKLQGQFSLSDISQKG